MPKVTLNPTFEAVQGKLGNIVYQYGREGTIARERVIPHEPHTAAQTKAQTAFATATAAYKNLTDAQADAWRSYALTITRRGRNGKINHPAACDLFVGLGSKFLQITPNGVLPALPPATAFFGDTITITAAGTHTSVNFTANRGNAANVKTELLLQALSSPNRKPDPDKCRTQQFFAFSSFFRTAIIFKASGWYAPAYRFVNVQTGQATPLTLLPVVHVI